MMVSWTGSLVGLSNFIQIPLQVSRRFSAGWVIEQKVFPNLVAALACRRGCLIFDFCASHHQRDCVCDDWEIWRNGVELGNVLHDVRRRPVIWTYVLEKDVAWVGVTMATRAGEEAELRRNSVSFSS